MPHILIVDDNKMLLETLRIALEGEHDITIAHSGEEALVLIGQKWPDLMITDYDMPGMNGLELIKRIRDLENSVGVTSRSFLRKNKMKIILYSACLNDAIIQEAKSLGVGACLDKPFDLEEIRKLITQSV